MDDPQPDEFSSLKGHTDPSEPQMDPLVKNWTVGKPPLFEGAGFSSQEEGDFDLPYATQETEFDEGLGMAPAPGGGWGSAGSLLRSWQVRRASRWPIWAYF